MLKNKLIDKIIKEPLGGAHFDRKATYENVKKEILLAFNSSRNLDPKVRIDKRREKFISMGRVLE
jgi:acetyl-CoA carboxylase carboxyl transferase subunit alpha